MYSLFQAFCLQAHRTEIKLPSTPIPPATCQNNPLPHAELLPNPSPVPSPNTPPILRRTSSNVTKHFLESRKRKWIDSGA